MPVIPSALSQEEIANMGLDEFLSKYGGVTIEIASTFSQMYTPSTSQQDPVINLDLYVSLMVSQARKNVLKTLHASYTPGIDYVEQETKKEQRKHSRGGINSKEVLLTPDCFKRLCMRSRTANAEVIRTYFLRMETLARKYFGAKTSKLQHNVNILLTNQRPKSTTMKEADVLDDTQGYIYVFPVNGRIPNLWRVGSTTNIQRRMREHGSSHADVISPLAKIKVFNVRKVEQCANFWLSEKKYRRQKEIYQGDYEMIKSIIVSCGLAGGVHADARKKALDDLVSFSPIVSVQSTHQQHHHETPSFRFRIESDTVI